MRALTASETRLLTLLGGVLFLVATVVGFSTWKKQSASLRARITAMRSERLSADAWLAEKSLWQERKALLDRTQPRAATVGEANSLLLERIQTTARSHDILIQEQAFLEPANTAHYQQSAVRLKVVGSMEGISKWMIDLLQPGNYQAVTSFSLQCDKQDPKNKLACDLVVARWYQPKGS